MAHKALRATQGWQDSRDLAEILGDAGEGARVAPRVSQASKELRGQMAHRVSMAPRAVLEEWDLLGREDDVVEQDRADRKAQSERMVPMARLATMVHLVTGGVQHTKVRPVQTANVVFQVCQDVLATPGPREIVE